MKLVKAVAVWEAAANKVSLASSIRMEFTLLLLRKLRIPEETSVTITKEVMIFVRSENEGNCLKSLIPKMTRTMNANPHKIGNRLSGVWILKVAPSRLVSIRKEAIPMTMLTVIVSTVLLRGIDVDTERRVNNIITGKEYIPHPSIKIETMNSPKFKP
jgi:hypothetical protein